MRNALSVYFLLIAVGAIVFRLDASMPRGNRLSPERALFSAVNAATLTGFQQSIPTSDYQEPARWMLLVLTLGGTLFSFTLGGIALSRILRLPYSPAHIIKAALALLALTLLAGIILPLDRYSLFNSIFKALSALANSGLYLGSAPEPGQPLTYLFLLPLAVLGGLGLPVLLELWNRRPLSLHTRVVLTMTAGLYLAAFLLLTLLLWSDSTSWQATLLSSSTLAINSRTAGFPFEWASALPRAAQWLLLILMAIGASPAGTAGGLKTTTLFALARGIRDSLSGKTPTRIFPLAVAWTTFYILAILTGTLLLMIVQPDIPIDRLLFMSVSATSNVGLSHDAISLTRYGVYTVSLLMLLGRIAPLIILWWLSKNPIETDLAIA